MMLLSAEMLAGELGAPRYTSINERDMDYICEESLAFWPFPALATDPRPTP